MPTPGVIMETGVLNEMFSLACNITFVEARLMVVASTSALAFPKSEKLSIFPKISGKLLTATTSM